LQIPKLRQGSYFPGFLQERPDSHPASLRHVEGSPETGGEVAEPAVELSNLARDQLLDLRAHLLRVGVHATRLAGSPLATSNTTRSVLGVLRDPIAPSDDRERFARTTNP
jgi:hypothetical protein